MIRVVSIFCLLGALTACQQRKPEQTYADRARYLYTQGVEALEDSNYIDAIKDFTEVKNKFPYSQYAALAELRVGDTYFDQDKFVEAVDSYRIFTRRRPNHAEVPYAMWRIGQSYDQQRPGDFFLFPPAYEKDRGTTKDAVRAYRAFLGRFPNDKRAAQASKRLLDCRAALADYELYVARLYLKQSRPVSARGRLETVHARFKDVPGRWRTGSLMLVRVYLALTKPDAEGEIPLSDGAGHAARVAQALVDAFPKSAEAAEARTVLKILKRKG